MGGERGSVGLRLFVRDDWLFRICKLLLVLWYDEPLGVCRRQYLCMYQEVKCGVKTHNQDTKTVCNDHKRALDFVVCVGFLVLFDIKFCHDEL